MMNSRKFKTQSYILNLLLQFLNVRIQGSTLRSVLPTTVHQMNKRPSHTNTSETDKCFKMPQFEHRFKYNKLLMCNDIENQVFPNWHLNHNGIQNESFKTTYECVDETIKPKKKTLNEKSTNIPPIESQTHFDC